MKQQTCTTISLLLITSIAMAMLFAFGIKANVTASQCEVSAIQCKHTQLILTAKGEPASR